MISVSMESVVIIIDGTKHQCRHTDNRSIELLYIHSTDRDSDFYHELPRSILVL